MADYSDTMHARHEADSRLADLLLYTGQLETGPESELPFLLARVTQALCLELRSLQVTLDHMVGELTAATGQR